MHCLMSLCPCQSHLRYQDCCQPFHLNTKQPENAEQLMRSRYSAYTLCNIDYIVQTTLPAQQPFLDRQAMQHWARDTDWQGLSIHSYQPHLSKIHSVVAFTADFYTPEGMQHHDECSIFVYTQGRWYFVDPNTPRPTAKQPCLCGSGKKFKHCCGLQLITYTD
ncbi:MAG: YchJ family protein [Pasteurellaceae bacterium]|nr:YchJ family protein [Pasteurellaceae bacterium]